MSKSNSTTKLPYTHGIEIENYLVDNNGDTIIGENLLVIWDEMFNRAYEFLKKKFTSKTIPSNIKKKIKKVYVAEEIKREKKLKFVFVNYQIGKKSVKVNIFGPDPNISQITWLLELVTPPCDSLDELDWWLRTLFSAAEYGLKGNSAKLLTIGLNPTEKEYKSGLSCGIHHHIGINDINLKLESYNMIRNFIPHIIALTSTSPFLDKKPSGNVIIKEDADGNGFRKVITRDCIHSYRLMFNTGQMGPNIPEYLPIIMPSNKIDKYEFSRLVKKPAPNDRMVDLYPFTDYNTIELRIFDAHPFIELHLATVLLIQALVLKTKKILTNKSYVPYVDSKSIFENRNKAIQYGFLGNFNRDFKLNKDFDLIYNTDIKSNKKASKLIHSYNSLISYLSEELETLSNSNQLDMLLLPIFGDKNNKILPPFGLVEYFLFHFQKISNNNINQILTLFTYNKNFKFDLKPNGTILDLITSPVIDKEQSTAPIITKSTNKNNLLSNKLKSDLRIKMAKTRDPIEERKVTKKPKKKEKILSSSKTKPKSTKIDKPKLKSKQEIIKKPPAVKTSTKTKVTKTKVAKDKNVVEKKKIDKKEEKPQLKDKKAAIKKEKLTKTAKTNIKVDEKVIPVKANPKAEIMERITSASSQEIEILNPIIPIDPKYGTYNSKIASAMRERRIEREKRRKKELLLRQEKEKIPFKPTLKTLVFNFPKKVSGNGVFGNINIKWPKGTHYKLSKNPVTIFSTIKSGNKSKRYKFTTKMDINLIKKGISNIPVFFELTSFEGLVEVTLEGRTATNEVLFQKNLKITKTSKKEGIIVKENEFYVTGRYGQVEMVFKGTARTKKKAKGKMRVFIASQNAEIEILNTNYNLKDKQIFEIAETIELHPTLQHGLFWIVAKISDGKNVSFEAIKIDPIEEEIVSWDFESIQGFPDLKGGLEPKKRYLLNFHLQFNKYLPAQNQVNLFATTFPEGRTIKLSTAKLEKEINKGDTFVLEKIEIKMPKKIGYIYFSCDIITSKGLLSQQFITEPIGVQRKS